MQVDRDKCGQLSMSRHELSTRLPFSSSSFSPLKVHGQSREAIKSFMSVFLLLFHPVPPPLTLFSNEKWTGTTPILLSPRRSSLATLATLGKTKENEVSQILPQSTFVFIGPAAGVGENQTGKNWQRSEGLHFAKWAFYDSFSSSNIQLLSMQSTHDEGTNSCIVREDPKVWGENNDHESMVMANCVQFPWQMINWPISSMMTM